MLQSGMKSAEDNLNYSPASITTPTSTLPLLCRMGLKPNMEEMITNEVSTRNKQKYAINLTQPLTIQTPKIVADTSTYAPNVSNKDMAVKTVKCTINHSLNQQPKYLCHDVWCEEEFTKTVAESTAQAIPLPQPQPPLAELDNPITSKAIANNPSLFKIVTPVE